MYAVRHVEGCHDGHAREKNEPTVDSGCSAAPTIDEYDGYNGEGEDADCRDAGGKEGCFGGVEASLLEE